MTYWPDWAIYVKKVNTLQNLVNLLIFTYFYVNFWSSGHQRHIYQEAIEYLNFIPFKSINKLAD